MNARISTAIRITVSGALIALLLYIMRDKYAQIGGVLKSTDIALFSLAVLIYLGALLLASIRLQLITKVQALTLTFREAVSLTYIGYFFNNFLPTAIGGDVVKAYYLSRKGTEKTSAYTAIFIDRAIGLATMVFMAFIAILFVGSDIIDMQARNAIYAITAVSALGILLLVHKGFAQKFAGLLKLAGPLENQLKKAYFAIHDYRRHTLLIVQTLSISVTSQLLFFSSMGILALAIGSRISTFNILLRMPIVSMISLLPSINGLGVREGSTVLVFGPLIGKANAFAVSILVIATLLIVSFIGGLIYAFSPQFKVKLREIEKEAV